jgi:hypothetical protein
VALTLKKAEADTELMKMIDKPFPELPPELAGALDCPDFRDKTFFDRLIDIFGDNEIDYEKAGKSRRPFRVRIIRR